MVKGSSTTDRYGLPITTASATAAEKLVEGVDMALEYGYGADERFKEALQADEDFALAHAGLAYLHMTGGRADEARSSAKQAQDLAAGTSRREQQQIEVIARWANGKGTDALALIHEHLAEFPRDMLMVRVAQRLFVLGCSSVGAGVANYPREHFALMNGLAPAYGNDWAFQSQYAFAHHEVGLLDDALKLAERSLEQRPTNAVASHSVAHVYFERADCSSGADFLAGWLPGFDNRVSYHVHLSWHLALFELAMGHYQRALDIYENSIRPSVVAKSALSLNDSSSLLWRLQIYGAAAPPSLTKEVETQAAPVAERPGVVAFRDSHAALAFAVADDDDSLVRMMDGLRAAADKGDRLVAEVTLPMVQGISAFMHQDYDEAVRLMEPLFGQEAPYDQVCRIGGSHAQREVFEDTLVEAYLRAGQHENAESLLGHRLKRRETPRDLFWLARAQQANGKREAAEASARQAQDAWQGADRDSQETGALTELAENLG
ncbi:MAG: tetratricopeptide repeat protein [Chloroflexi bacterium]|nr:tetratricopeptide repeat protein [Chloroflexota bacterium]